MKVLIPALLLAATSIAQADISVKKVENRASSNVILTLTGAEAQALKDTVSDYEGATDSILQNGAGQKDDFSMIRSVRCGADTCEMEIEADVLTKKDTQEYYSQEFNKALQSLADGEVLVSPLMGKSADGMTALDSRFLRLMMEKSNSLNHIHVKASKPGSLKNADQVSSVLYEVSMSSGSLAITCYSSIVTGMGNVNSLSESCAVNAVAKTKASK